MDDRREDHLTVRLVFFVFILLIQEKASSAGLVIEIIPDSSWVLPVIEVKLAPISKATTNYLKNDFSFDPPNFF